MQAIFLVLLQKIKHMWEWVICKVPPPHVSGPKMHLEPYTSCIQFPKVAVVPEMLLKRRRAKKNKEKKTYRSVWNFYAKLVFIYFFAGCAELRIYTLPTKLSCQEFMSLQLGLGNSVAKSSEWVFLNNQRRHLSQQKGRTYGLRLNVRTHNTSLRLKMP